MSSFSQQFNPRANVFLLVNLGCEMLYVIDQRLRAQQIDHNKSVQVIHDVTAVLLDKKFLDSLIVGSTHVNAQLFTPDHCKFMLNDIAVCSLMRLDAQSMDKLWNLMTMLYKWQLFVSKYKHHLLDITFRHLDAVARLHPEENRSKLIDFTKNTLLEFWNAASDEEQLSIYRTNKAWLEFYNTKISLLIRLGFQALDGSFLTQVEHSYFQEFADSIGENIYDLALEVATRRRDVLYFSSSSSNSAVKQIGELAELLNFSQTQQSNTLAPFDPPKFQQQYEQNLQQCNILFGDMNVNNLNYKIGQQQDDAAAAQQPDGEFVRLQPIYSRHLDGAKRPITEVASRD